MKKYLFFWLFYIYYLISPVNAQINIFLGGNADGSSHSNIVLQNSDTVYKGGNADGFAKSLISTENSLNVFLGDSADGWAKSQVYTENSLNVFVGSAGDGYAASGIYTENSISIFSGGNTDGYAKNGGNFLSTLTATAVITPATCANLNNGSITINASMGTSPYQYNIGSGYQNNNSFSGLAGNTTYNISVLDSLLNVYTLTATVSSPPPLNGIANTTSATCNNVSNGTLTITASGGTSPYTYYVGGNMQTSNTFVNLLPNTYNISIIDDNGCLWTQNATVGQTNNISLANTSNSVSCFGANDGSCIIAATGGFSPYLYNIGNGNQSANVFNNLSAGNYNVVVTDNLGCTANTNISINSPNSLTATANYNNIPCYGTTTTVTIGANGGTPPYNGTGNFTVGAGTHTFTVTDNNSCQDDVTFTVYSPSNIVASASATAILCHGGNSTVTVTGTGGTAPYNGTGSFTVIAGTYQYIITDNNGCKDTVIIPISEPTQLVVNANVQPLLCDNGTTTANVVANGGTPPYNGTGTFSVAQGNYVATVMDANGCIVSANAITIIPQNYAPSANFSPQNISGGTYQFNNLSTGTTPSYNWNFGITGANSSQTNPSYTYTTNGTYVVSLIASNLCGSDTFSTNIVVSGLSISNQNTSLQDFISIYPNPTENVLYLSNHFLHAQNAILRIYDINTKIVIEKEAVLIPNEVFKLNVSNLSSAKYTLSIMIGDKIYNSILVKQ